MSHQVTKQKKPTIRQVARRAGVSLGTSSRVLNGFDSVSPANVKRVKEAAAALGYCHEASPWKPARRRPLSRTIIAPINRAHPSGHVERLLESDPCHSFERELNERGFRLYFQFVEHEQMQATITQLSNSPQQCDGVLIMGRIASEAVAGVLKENHFPHICFDYLAEQYEINTVRPHAAESIRRAVGHLYDLGHRQIGFLGSLDNERYPLTLTALAEKGLSMDGVFEGVRRLVRPEITTATAQHWHDAGRDALEGWLKEGLNVTALICSNDDVALGAIETLRERGLMPGRDLSLIGYDNIEVRGPEPAAHPVLTTIDNPTDRIGRRMAQFLLNQILQQQTQIVHERLPATLIVRETTGMCPDQPDEPLLTEAGAATGSGELVHA